MKAHCFGDQVVQLTQPETTSTNTHNNKLPSNPNDNQIPATDVNSVVDFMPTGSWRWWVTWSLVSWSFARVLQLTNLSISRACVVIGHVVIC